MLTIHLFRSDLRLEDNLAFKKAIESDGKILPIYIYDEALEAPWALGGASRWWLHHALVDLQAQLNAIGLNLYIVQGDTQAVLEALLSVMPFQVMTLSRRYEPHIVEKDRALKAHLTRLGVEVFSFNNSLLFEPQSIANKVGQPYQVFTPFWKYCQTLLKGNPVSPFIKKAELAVCPLKTVSVEALHLLPHLNWADGFSIWKPTRHQGLQLLNDFIDDRLIEYKYNRDFPALKGTSSLSPYLHFGQIGPREIITALKKYPVMSEGALCFYSELGWREFAYHLLWHFPKTPREPLRAHFKDFPWIENSAWIKAWQRGETGYPIVDAGMRQLWQTGIMHNRVRMVVASFLVKHLLQPWICGAEWFWDTLVDADLASNTLGWQWSAGCGADAAPYFRIFNPILQGEKFDAQGDYVRQYVPELKNVPNRYLHRPWEAGEIILSTYGVVLGKTYPQPLILPEVGRQKALEAYAQLKMK